MGQKTKFLVDLKKETPASLAHMCMIYQLQKENLEKLALFCKVAFGLCILIGVYKAVASKWARKILGFIYSQAVPHIYSRVCGLVIKEKMDDARNFCFNL